MGQILIMIDSADDTKGLPVNTQPGWKLIILAIKGWKEKFEKQ